MSRVICNSRVAVIVLLGVGSAALPDTARAEPETIFTFGFQNVHGAYDGNSTWTMAADANTMGAVARTVPVESAARFGPGTMGETADFTLTMNVSRINGARYGGSGSLVITDADGDTITGSLDGAWRRVRGRSASFEGVLSDVRFTGTGEGATFDGTLGGSVPMSFPGLAGQPFEGAVISLDAAGWFGFGFRAFRDEDAVVSAIVHAVIPAPSAVLLGLMGFGGLQCLRRRR